MTSPKVISEATDDEPLETTYYCRAEESKILETVVELKGKDDLRSFLVIQRYTIVIDVSGSMDSKLVVNDPRTLLFRVKSFAIQFVNSMNDSNWLSIVTFSNVAEPVMKMTQMTEDNKTAAKILVAQLIADNCTNLEAGLEEGLKAAAELHPAREQTNDCIILFTDGLANEGETDPNILAENYQQTMRELMNNGRVNHVQFAAITFDYYEPVLLSNLRNKLSSDVFYVLNAQQQFEVDMLFPLIFRQSAYLSDIDVQLTCTEGVTFSREFLNLIKKIPGKQKIIGETKMKCFFHSLPESILKNIYLSLDIRRRKKDVVLDVSISYLDTCLQRRQIKEYIHVDQTPIEKIRPQAAVQRSISFYEKQSMYVVIKSSVQVSWEVSQKSCEKLISERARFEALSAFSSESVQSEKMDEYSVISEFYKSIKVISKMQEDAKLFLGETNAYYRRLQRNLNVFSSILSYNANNIRNIPWARIQAVASSLQEEMPTPSGVFGPEVSQPYLTEKVLKLIVQHLNELSQENTEFGSIKQNEFQKQLEERANAEKKLKQTMKDRNAKKLEIAIKECLEINVDVTLIEEAEHFLEIVKEEDFRLNDIALKMKSSDLYNLTISINNFRHSEHELMDRNGIVKKAENHVQIEIKKIQHFIEKARQAEEDNKMQSFIESLKPLCETGFVDEKVIVVSERNLDLLRRQIKLQLKFDKLKVSVTAFIEDENLSELESSLLEMKSLMDEEDYKSKDANEKFYKKSRSQQEVLIEKYQLLKDIKETWKKSKMDWIPENLLEFRNISNYMKELKKQAKKHPGVFTNKDEEKLKDLQICIDNLAEKTRLRDKAEERLREELNKDKYLGIVSALEVAENTLFVDKELIKKATLRAEFLNPETRIKEIKEATKGKNFRRLQQAIDDIMEAGLSSREDLLGPAKRRLEVLRKANSLNELLYKAMKTEDLEQLKKALHRCDSNPRVKNQDIEFYEEAVKLKEKWTQTYYEDLLKQAIKSKDPLTLSSTLKKVEGSGFKKYMMDLFEKARSLGYKVH